MPHLPALPIFPGLRFFTQNVEGLHARGPIKTAADGGPSLHQRLNSMQAKMVFVDSQVAELGIFFGAAAALCLGLLGLR